MSQVRILYVKGFQIYLFRNLRFNPLTTKFVEHELALGTPLAPLSASVIESESDLKFTGSK